ncbi:hypothetical protein C8R44DRAFT_868615 [Mycena epipterygia]|nr:hypothetical protein C8R44DRAFT_868615 [Mycena epipterygia]
MRDDLTGSQMDPTIDPYSDPKKQCSEVVLHFIISMVRCAFFASLPFPHSLLRQLLPPSWIANAKTLMLPTPTYDFRARFYDKKKLVRVYP